MKLCGGVMNISRRHFLQFLSTLPIVGSSFTVSAKQQYPKRSRTLINRFSVAGFQYYDGPSVFSRLQSGDILTMKPEPSNPHDIFAVELFHGKTKLGYVPRSDNKHISRLLQNAVNLHVEVKEVNPTVPLWNAVKVDVYLEQS
jgi:hypothetical protein